MAPVEWYHGLRFSVEHDTYGVEEPNRCALVFSFIERVIWSHFDHDLPAWLLSRLKRGHHSRSQRPDIGKIDERPTRNSIMRATGAQAQHGRRGRQVAGGGRERDTRCRCRGVREVDEPLCDAQTGGVLAYDDELGSLEHFGRASRSRVRLGVGTGFLALPHVSEIDDSAYRLRADDAVCGQTRVSLELPNRSLCERTEYRVSLTAGEPKRVERLLEGTDIAAVEVGQPQIEHAVAKHETRIDERRPGLIPDQTVFGKMMLRLE